MSSKLPGMDKRIPSGDLQLAAHLQLPDIAMGRVNGIVLCHGFPVKGRESAESGKSFPEFARRIAMQCGLAALAFNYRGCGTSDGNFSMAGWLDDISAAVAYLESQNISNVWLAGAGTGGTLAMCQAARDPRIRGVATLGAPADFKAWGKNPRRLLENARALGVITDDSFPKSFEKWVYGIRNLTAEKAGPRLRDRPLLVLHGDQDDLVEVNDGRAIAEAHGNSELAQLKVIAGAGHELRHDPRAVAVLLGWLSRTAV